MNLNLIHKLYNVLTTNVFLYYFGKIIIFIIISPYLAVTYLAFLISGYLRVKHFAPAFNKYQTIPKLKNKYLNKRCFIIATGPSLKISDLEKLQNEYTFGLNSLYKLYEQTFFRPAFYLISDHFLYQQALQENHMVDSSLLAKQNVFLNSKLIKYALGKKSSVIFLPMYYRLIKLKRVVPSTDLLFGIKDISNVVLCSIFVAYYLGFREIYLLGCDCNYNTAKKHCAEMVNNDHLQTKNSADYVTHDLIKNYQVLKDFFAPLGVKIYNATRGGKLEVFERVDLDEVLRKNHNQ